jgi:FAD/FMN-containing dehydrogenase
VDIAVHRPINAAMDPDNILNPGTVLTLGDL